MFAQGLGIKSGPEWHNVSMPPTEPLRLTPNEARVLGALVEKEVTTPEYYPLTLNALSAVPPPTAAARHWYCCACSPARR